MYLLEGNATMPSGLYATLCHAFLVIITTVFMVIVQLVLAGTCN